MTYTEQIKQIDKNMYKKRKNTKHKGTTLKKDIMCGRKKKKELKYFYCIVREKSQFQKDDGNVPPKKN